MNKFEFRDLLKRYLDNNCSEEECAVVESVYGLIGEDKEILLGDLEGVGDEIWSQVKVETEKGIILDLNVNTDHQKSRKISSNWFKIAGIALLIVCAITFFKFQTDFTGIGEGNDFTVTNQLDEVMTFWLEDNTKVILYPNSSLSKPFAFEDSDKREVHLTGEAIFDVTKDASKPFYVHTRDVVTRVIGTSFKITDFRDDNIGVEVLSGKVAVYNDEGQDAKEGGQIGNGVVLTPNQKVTYYTENKQFVTSVVANPVLISDQEKKESEAPSFIYDETEIEIVLNDLEQNYGIQIEVVENERLSRCPLTADLSGQSLYDKIEMICVALNASYEVKGTTILINGRGCN